MGLKSFFQNTENEHSETTPLFGGKRDVIEHEDEYKYALIDSTGNTISDFYDEIESFSDEFALVTNNDTYALMNSDGQILTAWYESIDPFDGYFSLVMNDKDEYSLIDKKGNLVSPWNEDEEMILKIQKMRNLELNLVPNNTQNEVIIEQQSMEQKNVAKDAEPINPSLQQEKNDTTHNLKTDSMYNEQLEKLIEMALVDGELTEKEKQILFKKAEAFGVDLDEFEMVLQAKLFEKQKNNKPVSAAPTSDKLGDVRKCPACGAIAETFATRCSECGTEFRNIEASQNIIKFFEKLDDIESNRRNNNLEEETQTWSTIDSRKEELVLNFPIPTSNEEIFEFLTLATSRINSNTYFNTFTAETKYKNRWNKIWLQKIEQISSKASLAMKDDKKSLDEVNRFAENARLIVKSNNQKVLHIALGFITLIAALIIWGVISIKINDNKLNQQTELKTKAETFIKAGEYDKAEEIITILENESFIVELKSKIQLEELTKQIDALEIYLNQKKYSNLKFELEKITWSKISRNSETYNIEGGFFDIYIKKKEAINNQLPEKFKIDIESSSFGLLDGIFN